VCKIKEQTENKNIIMHSVNYNGNIEIRKLEAQLKSTFLEEEIKLLFAGFIVFYFQKRGKWSGKPNIVTSVEFRDLEIVVTYGYINGHTLYKRNFFERHINQIVDFINTNPVNMSTKQLYSDRLYNNFDTIIKNKNIVVIKYINEGFTTLLSMTLGDYYVAEKIIVDGIPKYALLSHNKMDRHSDSMIQVNQNTSGSSIKRFEEFGIGSWIEQNNFDNAEIMLCPVIAGHKYMDPLTGKLHDISYQLQISKISTSAQLQHNLGMKSGYATLWQNTYGSSSGSNSGVFITNSSNEIIYDDRAIKNWNAKAADVTKAGMMYHKMLEKVMTGKENDEDIERRIDNTNTPIKRHTTAPNIGMNDDYLLIN
jgi:hypothetical protein